MKQLSILRRKPGQFGFSSAVIGLGLLVIASGFSGCGRTGGEPRVREGRPPEADVFGMTTQSERERQRTRSRQLSESASGGIVQFDARSGSTMVRLRRGETLDADTRFFVVTDIENDTKGFLVVDTDATHTSRFIRSFLLEGTASLGDSVRYATENEASELLDRHHDRLESE